MPSLYRSNKLPHPIFAHDGAIKTTKGAIVCFLKTAGLHTKTCKVTMAILLHNEYSLCNVFQTLLNELDASHKGSADLIDTIKENLKANDRTVKQLIKDTTDNKKLALMFPGWAPFI